jgi:hypothetical protein
MNKKYQISIVTQLAELSTIINHRLFQHVLLASNLNKLDNDMCTIEKNGHSAFTNSIVNLIRICFSIIIFKVTTRKQLCSPEE